MSLIWDLAVKTQIYSSVIVWGTFLLEGYLFWSRNSPKFLALQLKSILYPNTKPIGFTQLNWKINSIEPLIFELHIFKYSIDLQIKYTLEIKRCFLFSCLAFISFSDFFLILCYFIPFCFAHTSLNKPFKLRKINFLFILGITFLLACLVKNIWKLLYISYTFNHIQIITFW